MKYSRKFIDESPKFTATGNLPESNFLKNILLQDQVPKSHSVKIIELD